MTVTQETRTIEFPCEEWIAQRTLEGELVGIKPVAGSWTLVGGDDRRRFAERGLDVKAMFACPRCEQVGFIPESFNPTTVLGDSEVLPELRCRKCHFGCRAVLKDWDKRKLYCAAFETRDGDSLKPHKEYLHAVDLEEATRFFWAQHPRLGEVSNLVGIAPVVGFFAKSEKDDRTLVV
jgi:hypothetical protein